MIAVFVAFFAVVAIGGWFNLRSRIQRLEVKIRHLRELAVRPLGYRRLEPSETALGAGLDRLTAETEQMRSLGFEILGDLIEDSESKLATRWFVDPARTTFGWLGMIEARGMAIPVALFASHRADGAAYTRRVPRIPGLAMPPFVRRQDVAATMDLAHALLAHNRFAGVEEGEWIRVESLDDVIREMPRVRALTIAWREAQPPADLLDQDLRAILGKHYERLGPVLAKKLGPEIPRAKAL